MSSNDTDSDDVESTIFGYSSEYNALSREYNPKLNYSGASTHGPSSRADLGAMGVGQARAGNELPTLWDGVGYPAEGALTFADHWLRYERQGFARGIIDKPANSTWQEPPEIVDDGRSIDNDVDGKTDFEQQIHQFFEGEHTRRKPHHRMCVADKLARLGKFSLIVLGFGDGRDLSEPVQGVHESTLEATSSQTSVDDGEDTREFDSLDDLAYITVFGEDRVESIDTVTDMRDERFRLPETYEVITEEDESDGDEQTTEIHWTRVIHVPQGALENDVEGTRELKPVWNNLLNLEKINAASGEGYWRGGYQGLVVTPPETQSGEVAQFEDDGEAVHNQIRQYEQNMMRTLFSTGNINTLDSTIDSPTPHIEAQVREIAACKEQPQSILMGNETGERATSEDKKMWHEFISGVRNTFAEPVILLPIINRLIDVGVLPEPAGDSYTIDWSSLYEMSEETESQVRERRANTLNTLSNGDPERLASRAELRKKGLGWSAEYGSEVDDDFDPDNPELDEFDADMQDAYADGGEDVDEQNEDDSNQFGEGDNVDDEDENE